MSEAEFLKELAEYERPYRRMEYSLGDPGAVPVTKLGGVPWWPAGIERPICEHGHKMAFIAQILLSDVPEIEPERPPTLLSFHYCEQCMFDGNMTFGWRDKGRQLRYRVSLFTDFDKMPIDELGIVADSTVTPVVPSFHDGMETMSFEDIREEFPDREMPDLDKVFNEQGDKLGGWAYWLQWPESPEDEMGNEMRFIAQLYGFPGDSISYLYLSELSEDEPEAEFTMQCS